MNRIVTGRFSGRPFIVPAKPRHLGSFEGRKAARARRRETIEAVALFGLATVFCLGVLLAVSAAPTARLIVTTATGDSYVAGEGDTCRDAWQGAVIPADWREIVCR